MRATKCDECGFSDNDDRGWSHLKYHGDNTFGGPADYHSDFCPSCTDAVFRVVRNAEPQGKARRGRGVFT